ncbi:hypothetical protein [Psychroserpens sp. SPM9]|uniref:hypothetical protein n=1 Tax=Psychroserpens sp. SPM9 TaxID=2975598 RepID=UPI0021A3339C|nr:hypothetical protein [Psychroserpens sp. SPM9]MDG5491646.1 hypothetical protein [Psychroserpens sp. SPM9]
MKKISTIKNYLTDLVIILIIAQVPLLFYVKELLSVEKLNSTVEGFDISYDILLWFLAVKLQVIILLIIWYFTSQHWWKNALLVPMTLEFFKLISFFNTKVESFDEIDFITSIPITIPLIFSIIFLSKRVNQFHNHQVIYKDLNSEIENTFNEINKNIIDDDKLIISFQSLKTEKDSYKRTEYLKKLIELRNKFY